MNTAKEIAYCSAAVALLVGGQFLLSGVSGVELVTVLLLVFSYAFGAVRGMAVATAFSLLRTFLFGFFPYVVVLYLVYYNLFALFFGLLGRHRSLPVWISPVLLPVLMAGCLYIAIAGVPLDFVGKRVSIAGYILFGVFTALFIAELVLLILGKGEGAKEAISLATLASLFTVGFTLLDDCLWPLWAGLNGDGALFYFYNGFLAMIPQTVCAAVTTFLLFRPLYRIFSSAARSLKKGKKTSSNIGRGEKDML